MSILVRHVDVPQQSSNRSQSAAVPALNHRPTRRRAHTATSRHTCNLCCDVCDPQSDRKHVLGGSATRERSRQRHAQHRLFPAGDPAAATWAHRNAAAGFDGHADARRWRTSYA